MPSCPNCHQTLLGHADVCYKCNYDFKLKRVVNKQEIQRTEEVRANEIKRMEEETAKIFEKSPNRSVKMPTMNIPLILLVIWIQEPLTTRLCLIVYNIGLKMAGG